MILEFLVKDWVCVGLRQEWYIRVEACGIVNHLYLETREQRERIDLGPFIPLWKHSPEIEGPPTRPILKVLHPPATQAFNALTFGRILVQIIMEIISMGKDMICHRCGLTAELWKV